MIGMALYEALYGHKCRSLVHWYEAGKRKYLGLELVKHDTESIKRIQQRIKMAQSWHKSYTDI